MGEPQADLVAALREHAGDALRVVGTHDDSSWQIEYMRDDVASTYGDDSIDNIADDLVFDVLGIQQQESLYELGDLRATVRLFEDGFVVHVPYADHRGCLVSLDGDAPLRGREVVELVEDAVDE